MNIKKPLSILAIICLTCILNAKAQTNIGLDAGISYNKLKFKPANNNLILSSKQGYIINLNIDHKLNNWIAVEASPGVLQKNYSVKNTNNIYQDVNNTYLQLPISIKFNQKLLSRLSLSGAIGGYYAYWLKSTINGIVPNVFKLSTGSGGDELIKVEGIKSEYTFSERDNRLELGCAAKLGLNYRILNALSFSIKGHYYRSLTDQQKQITELQATRYDETLAATIGIAYSFK